MTVPFEDETDESSQIPLTPLSESGGGHRPLSSAGSSASRRAFVWISSLALCFSGLYYYTAKSIAPPPSASDHSSQQSLSATETTKFKSRIKSPSKYDSDVIYAHSHIARTAGSSMLDQLAGKYERVCSNKANSVEFFANRSGDEQNWCQYNQSVHRYQFLDLVEQDQCDFVSSEFKANFWIKQKQTNWNDMRVELHVPCKAPVDLLMANCAYRDRERKGFDCEMDWESIVERIHECFKPHHISNRFTQELIDFTADPANNITMRCFDNGESFGKYMNYLDERLRHRSMPIQHIHQCSFSDRDRDRECIWKDEYTALREKVDQYLEENFLIISYCNHCMNTEDDLLFQY